MYLSNIQLTKEKLGEIMLYAAIFIRTIQN